ncbi:hypothetical protein [Wenyingzhuangia sp. IMCC45574]
MKKFILAAVTLLVLTNCSSESEVENLEDINTQNTANFDFFMSGKIDGIAFLYSVLDSESDGKYKLISSRSSTYPCVANPKKAGVNYYSGINTNDDEFSGVIGIEFVKFYLCSERKKYEQTHIFNSKFPIGDYLIALKRSVIEGVSNSIAFAYYMNDNLYTTLGDQTGSYVTIIKSTPDNQFDSFNKLISVAQIVEGEYSVKLYNESDNSDVITITNGKFKMRPSISNF